MTTKQMKQMGIDPSDFDCILDDQDVYGILDGDVIVDDEEEE